MTIEEVLSAEETQIFDRKSIHIDPKALAIPIIAFANADGGTVAIGISDKTRRVEGIDDETGKVNELLRVPFDFCVPTVKAEVEKVPCTDFKGRANHVLLMHVEPSMEVHANQADEVFIEGESTSDYPIQKKRHTFEYLRTISHLRPRTNTFQAESPDNALHIDLY